MLKLTNENVKNLALIEGLSTSKTQTLIHSIKKPEKPSEVDPNPNPTCLSKVYFDAADEAMIGDSVAKTSIDSPEENTAVRVDGEVDWVSFFNNNADQCDSDYDGVIRTMMKSGKTKALDNEKSLGILSEDSSIEKVYTDVTTKYVDCPLSSVSTSFALKELSIGIKDSDTPITKTWTTADVVVTKTDDSFATETESITAQIVGDPSVDVTIGVEIINEHVLRLTLPSDYVLANNNVSSVEISIADPESADFEHETGTALTDLVTGGYDHVMFNMSSLSDGQFALSSISIGAVETVSDTFNSSVNDGVVTADLLINKSGTTVTLLPELSETVTLDKTNLELSRKNNNLVITLKTSFLYTPYVPTTDTSILGKEVIDVNAYTAKPIAKIDFGQDGYNKNHKQQNASVTKNSNFISGLKIAMLFVVDEIRYVTLGSINPATAKITINENIIVNADNPEDTLAENEALLTEIANLEQFPHVVCTTINRSEETPNPITSWDPDLSEIEELHPTDENGNPLENLIEGSIRLQVGEVEDAHGTTEEQADGCVILADRPVKTVLDENDFPRLVLDETAVTSNGVLNRFRSVSFVPQGETEEQSFFEKEAYSVGKVFYNTGVIELNNPVPVIEGVAPALRCSVMGMQNLKCNILNKGTDGNKYSIKITKDHVELNGDVIYNLSLVLNGTELDTIVCSSNPDGSVIEGTDASGNPTDVDVPFIGEIEHDVFHTSFIGEDVDDLKNLHSATYSCVGGTDGVDGITAKDYIGYKDESGVAGAWLFDDVKYPAQMWPSLGYTDKEFYMAAQDIAWNRKDTTCVWDVPKGYSKKSAIAYREEEPIPSQWWTELYYNWCNDVFNGILVELPPSYYVTKNSLASYKVNGTWYPVAGKERGTIDAASVINQVPAKLDRDEFITHNINPIYDTGNQGIQIYGNDTLNAQYTDLSAAHIARTLTYIRSKVDAYTETLKFELNDVVLWRTWVDYVKTKILEPIKAARGLQWFRASMGNDTTTAEELANRIVRGVIECQFNQDAEIFKLDYVVYSSAADNSTF